MARTTSTWYSPPVGCRLIMNDTQENKEIIVSTLSVRDRTPFKHRTPKGTPNGEEYFYVKHKVGKEWYYVKMMNSISNPECKSEDGRYVFDGKLPNGRFIASGKNKNKNKLEKAQSQVRMKTSDNTNFSFVSKELQNA